MQAPAPSPLPALSRQDMLEFLAVEFPQVFGDAPEVALEYVGHGEAHIRLLTGDKHLRPGGTVSGPSMMMLVDCTAYVAVLSVIGKVALAVTTNLNINFLRKPPREDIVCVARPLKIGKSLIIMEAEIYRAGDPDKITVAHATLTYSIPPQRTQAG